MIQIFTSDQNFVTSIANYEIRSTFNFLSHALQHRAPQGALKLVNKYVGTGNASINILAENNSISLLIPLQETLKVSFNATQKVVEIGEVLIIPHCSVEQICIEPILETSSTFEFYHLVITTEVTFSATDYTITTLPLADVNMHNAIHGVNSICWLPFQIHIGAFVGKHDYDISFSKSSANTIALPLIGTFEVEERLLFQEDILLMHDVEQVNVECLSEFGIILLLNY